VAGFRNVVLPLGIYGGSVLPADGGFITPIPGLRLGGGGGAPPVGALGGFGTPIGALLIRTAGRRGAGYVGVVPVIGLGATESGIIVPEDVYPPGMGRLWQEEDEDIMAIIISFLEIRR
jgi:hypothetical protein